MPGRTGSLRSIAFAVLVYGALCGCSHKSAPPTGRTAPPPPPFASSDSEEEYAKDDPCSLLEPKEVEAVLGAPLAVPPYRGANAASDPSGSSDTCIYEGANFRYISLEVTYEGGAQAYSMTNMVKGLMKGGGGKGDIANNVKKNFRLDDGTELSGEWDEASLTAMNCCIFNALRGDQLITIDFTASRATLPQAAGLIDSAYKRIDQPLKINGSAGIGAAKALGKTRPAPRDVCSLLTRAEVEAIVGKLGADPVAHGQSGCTFNLPVVPQTVPQSYDLEVRWRGGYYQWRTDRYVSHIGGAAVGQMAHDVVPGIPEPKAESHAEADEASATAAAADPAESVSDDGMHFVVVKKDVQVSVNSRFVDKERAQALVAAAAAKI